MRERNDEDWLDWFMLASIGFMLTICTLHIIGIIS